MRRSDVRSLKKLDSPTSPLSIMQLSLPFRVGHWLVEPSEGRISSDRRTSNLDPRLMDVLVCLSENCGRVVSKDELMSVVWSDVVVSDNTLSQTISRLRTALGDDWQTPTFIETVSKKGYRLIAPVEVVDSPVLPDSGPGSARPSQTRVTTAPRVFVFVVLTTIVVWAIRSRSTDHPSSFRPVEPVTASATLGLERFPSISPNGMLYAFVAMDDDPQKADIFVRSLDSHVSRQITFEVGPDVYPKWTADGESIVYIAVTDDEECGLFERSIHGGQRHFIGSCLQSPGTFDVSPVNDNIVFASAEESGSIRRLYLLDRRTRESRQLTFPPTDGSGDSDPAFSADGSYIVFTRSVDGRSELFRVPTVGGEADQISVGLRGIIGYDFVTSDALHALGYGSYETSGDDYLVVSSNQSGRRRLWLQPANGGAPTIVATGDRVPLDPSAAQDGRRLLFRSMVDQARLWRFNMKDTSEPAAVAPSTRSEIHPRIGPDGKRIAFLSNRTDAFEIWSVNASGNDLRQHTDLGGAFVNAPAFTHSGASVLFDAEIGGENGLYKVGLESGMQIPHQAEAQDAENGRQSTDGRFLYFSSMRSGQSEIWRREGKDGIVEQLTYLGGYFAQPSPDGRHVYYSKFGQPGIWRASSKPVGASDFLEELVLEDLDPMDGSSWYAGRHGVYYVCRNPDGVCRFDPDMGRSIRLVDAPRPIPRWSGPTLSVSPTEEWFVLAMSEMMDDEIRYIDFR